MPDDITRFAHPWAFALLIVPVVALLIHVVRGPAASMRVGTVGVFEGVPRTLRQQLLWLPAFLWVAGFALLVVAAARPQAARGEERTQADVIAMMLVIDRSSSMDRSVLTYDGETVTRLEAARRVVNDFLLGEGDNFAERSSDLIGAIAFAGYADTVAPLAQNPEVVARLTARIEGALRNSPEDGTAIGDGLALAAARLREAERNLADRAQEAGDQDADTTIKSKAIILLTDGMETGGSVRALDAAQLCVDLGVRVYVVAIQGDPGNRGLLALREQRFQALAAQQLNAIAQRTGGVFRRVESGDDLRSVYAEIGALERTTVQSSRTTRYEERFPPFALAGMIALGIGGLLAHTVLRAMP